MIVYWMHLQEEGNRHPAAPKASTSQTCQTSQHKVKLLAFPYRPWYSAEPKQCFRHIHHLKLDWQQLLPSCTLGIMFRMLAVSSEGVCTIECIHFFLRALLQHVSTWNLHRIQLCITRGAGCNPPALQLEPPKPSCHAGWAVVITGQAARPG
jgi:hypothetical protein